MILKIGDSLDNGKYLIKSMLGSGGMGEVYLAHQVSVDREVAIKVLYQRLTHEVVVKRRFHREAKLMAKLNHPNCVMVYDFGETSEGILYIVMERLEGHTLAEELILKGSLPLNQTLSIIRQTCLALQRAHSLALVHRDLKPENIFLVPHEESEDNIYDEFHVKLLDFGIAKVLDTHVNEEDQDPESLDETLDQPLNQAGNLSETLDDLSNTLDDVSKDVSNQHQTSTCLSQKPKKQKNLSAQERRRQQRSVYTQENVIIGTPLYMSPEHVRNTDIDHRSDIYALGLILYECLSGRPAFQGSSVAELLIAHARQIPPRLSDSRPDLPPQISELIECCLAKRKEERLREVALILSYVQKFQSGEPLDKDLKQSLHQTLDEIRSSQEEYFSVSTPTQHSSKRSPLTMMTTMIGGMVVGLIIMNLFENSTKITTKSQVKTVQSSILDPLVNPPDYSLDETPKRSKDALNAPSLSAVKWEDLYQINGQVKPHKNTIFLSLFDQDVLGRSSRIGEKIPLHSSKFKTSLLVWNHWSWLQRDVTGKQLGTERLKGISFESPHRNILTYDTFIRLSQDFTIEMWLYFEHEQTFGTCPHIVISTLKEPNNSQIHSCNFDPKRWLGGWAITAQPNMTHIQLDFLRVNYLLGGKDQLIAQSLTSLLTLPYQRWNHVVLINQKETITWMINGEVRSQTHKHTPTIGNDNPIHLASQFDRTSSALNMKIDDLRISSEALPIDWLKRAYQVRFNHAVKPYQKVYSTNNSLSY